MARWPKKEPGEVTKEVLATKPEPLDDIPFAPTNQVMEWPPYAELVAQMRKPDLVPVRFARLHAPLFFGGKNHGDKLECTQQTPHLSMFWDRANRELIVKHHAEETVVTEANVANYTLGERFHKHEQVTSGITKAVPFTAQVSGPQSHVFAGPGAGLK